MIHFIAKQKELEGRYRSEQFSQAAAGLRRACSLANLKEMSMAREVRDFKNAKTHSNNGCSF